MSKQFCALIWIAFAKRVVTSDVTCSQRLYVDALSHPCGVAMNTRAPENFHILFGSNYGGFSAECKRDRAPLWVDRVFNLVLNGYYNDNYFFRVIPDKYIQFGTNGNPNVSNCYNFASPDLAPCAVLEPQPNEMPINMNDIPGLSNVFGTISMSTSYNETTETAWNATAELFINIGNNSHLDDMLFVPICTVKPYDMVNTVLKFPSFGEVQELGGDGISLEELYAEGNAYIESQPEWVTMALTSAVRITCSPVDNGDTIAFNLTCGPCFLKDFSDASVPYADFSRTLSKWECPELTTNNATCLDYCWSLQR